MECPRCQFGNADGSRFCGGCGSSLLDEVACSRCGHANPAGQTYCNGCGHPVGVSALSPERDPRAYTPKHLVAKILRSRSAIEGERKQVTVLFADLRNSMELAGRMGPEEWSQITQRLFQILADGVERFEGFVDKFTGDGIMALFGAPIAHEDHAQRACYAALHLRDALRAHFDTLRLAGGLDLAVRIGLNTGEVVFGKIGDDLRMDYTAQGFTVGLAQRMEQLAAAHSICVSEATARLAAGYVELRELGAATVKGMSHPVPVFELLGVSPHRTRLDVARSRGLTRFVGRDADLHALEAALEQARAGNGQVVGVVAEAGTGKSRLCFEFVQRCRAQGISVDEGHCPAHGKTVPYMPVLELLRGIFQIDDRDGDYEARCKIAGGLVLLDDRFRELLPILFDFLGVPDPERPPPNMSPEARQRQLIAFVRHLTQARSQRELRVLLIDDAHWIDAGSDRFLAQAVEAVSGTRTLLLVNFRPEYHADWMTKSYYRQIPLLPLGREATEELLADMLGRDPSIAGLADRIHERTGGNPFFIEEVALSLVESGRLEGVRGAHRLVVPVERIEIPDAVQAVLAARIDRLPEPEKRLLQTASVIGKELRESVLRRMAGLGGRELAGALAALVQGEFLVEKTLYPEAELAFKHPLTHEVAYESQLADRRARTHAAVAGAIEEVDAKRLDERAALLAHHWERAADVATASRWHARAARWCARDNPADALRHWSSVRMLLREAVESDETTSLRLEAAIWILNSGWRQGMSHDEARAVLAEGRELAGRRGDLRSHALLLAEFAGVTGHSVGDLAGMEEWVEQSIELAEKAGDPDIRFAVYEGRVDFLHFTGRLAEAARVCDEAIALADAQLDPSRLMRGIPVAWTFARRAWIEIEMGHLEEAANSLRRCDAGMRDREHTDVHAWTTIVWAYQRQCVGDAPGALSLARDAVDRSEKFGTSIARAWAHERLGAALHLNGECGPAVEQLALALGIAREARSLLSMEAEFLSYLAEALLGAGDAAQAQRTAEDAIGTGRRRKTPVWEAHAHLTLARVLLARHGVRARDEIESELGACLSLVERTEARVHEPHVHEVRAQLARLLGDEVTVERELGEAHRLFTATGATGHAERVAGQLADRSVIAS